MAQASFPPAASPAYSPLGRGILTGQIRPTKDFGPDDYRRMVERYSEESFHENLPIVDKFAETAETKHTTPGQLALACLMKLGDDVTPIPSTKIFKYLEGYLGGAGVISQTRNRRKFG